MDRIESYQLSLHPEKGGAFRIKVVGAEPSGWMLPPVERFAAVAAILREDPCYWNSQQQSLSTGAQAPELT